jgi:hypothetical protein
MRTVTAAGVAIVVLCASAAAAQVKTITGQTETASATIEAIDRTSRQVTLKNSDGKYEVLSVPQDLKRFDSLKVGDSVKVRYYENVVLRPHASGEKVIDTGAEAMTPRDDHRTRHGRSEGDVHGAERLDLQLSRRGQAGAGEGQGRRSVRHHLDDRHARLRRLTASTR